MTEFVEMTSPSGSTVKVPERSVAHWSSKGFSSVEPVQEDAPTGDETPDATVGDSTDETPPVSVRRRGRASDPDDL